MLALTCCLSHITVVAGTNSLEANVLMHGVSWWDVESSIPSGRTKRLENMAALQNTILMNAVGQSISTVLTTTCQTCGKLLGQRLEEVVQQILS